MTLTLSNQDVDRLGAARSCRFCSLDIAERHIWSDEDVIAVPSYGAFIDGWTLLVPRRHVTALSELGDVEWNAFGSATNEVRARVESVYGSTVAFEHGACGPYRSAGCGVDHAHLHLVPSAIDLRRAISRIADQVGEFDWRAARSRPRSTDNHDYIFLSDQTGAWVTEAETLPSQVVRRALAHDLGRAQWDWKADYCDDVVNRTLAALVSIR